MECFCKIEQNPTSEVEWGWGVPLREQVRRNIFFRWISLSGNCLFCFSYKKHTHILSLLSINLSYWNKGWKSSSKVLGLLICMFLKLHWHTWDFLIELQWVKYDMNTSKAEVLWLFSGDATKTSVSQVLEKCFYTRKSGHWNYKQALGALMSLYNILCYFTLLFQGLSKKNIKNFSLPVAL